MKTLRQGVLACVLTSAIFVTADLHGAPPNWWTVPPPPTPHRPLVPPAEPIVGTVEPSAFLPGSGSVAPTGEYRYQIPIQVPPGRAGMQPDLALTYSSRAGDGVVGVGWSISGLSEIHRCAKTFAIDGKSTGVDYDFPGWPDALCIDGNRLIWTGRGREKGTDYYVTEQETFARIESKSTLTGRSHERRFTVYAKDGRILEYEPLVMTDFPELGRGIDLVWPIARAKDRAGNEIVYEYDRTIVTPEAQPAWGVAEATSFSYAIEAITYGRPATPYNKVSFEYDPRTHPTKSWTKRIARVTDRQLRRINLSTPGHPDLGHYRLHLVLSDFTSRPLLQGVQRCSLQTCTQFKRFEYTASPLSFSENDYEDIAQPFIMPTPHGGLHVAEVAVMDADGNGLDDLVYPVGKGSEYPWVSHASVLGVQLFHPQQGSFAPSRTEFLQIMHLAPNVVVPVDADGDGDGRLEVVLFPGTGPPSAPPWEFKKGFRLFRWSAGIKRFVEDLTFPSVPVMQFGKPLQFPVYAFELFSGRIVGQTPYFADLDGDGRADMVRAEFTLESDTGKALDPRLMISRNVSGFFSPLQEVPQVGANFFGKWLAYRGARAIERYGEYRAGFHVTDAGQVSGAMAHTLFETDDGQLWTETDAACEKVAGRQHEVMLDVNGDGLHDRLCMRAGDAGSGNAEACINKGEGLWEACDIATFIPPLPANVEDPEIDWTNFSTGDFSGDGLDDLVVGRRGYDASILVYRAYPTLGGWAWTLDATFKLPSKIQYVRVGDFNGDGRLDIAAVYGEATGPTLRLHHQKPTFVDKLWKVREEGNAHLSEIVWYKAWQPASGSNTDCDYPQRCVKRGEIVVVRAHRTLNPTLPDTSSLSSATHYQYEEPRVDYKGRGFLGFETVRRWDPQRPIQVTSTYRNDVRTYPPHNVAYPRARLPQRTTTVIPILDVPKDGRFPDPSLPTTAKARVIEVETDYSTVWTASGGYWVHPFESRSKEWEEEVCIDWDSPSSFAGGAIKCVDGPGEVALRTRIETYKYDEYGSLEVHATHTVGGTLSETVTDYENRINEWLLGLPKARTVKSAKDKSAPWEIRTTGFVHDTRGLLTRVEVEPFSTDLDLRLTIEYKRDSAGLVTGVRRTAPGLVARHQYVHYDASGIFPDVIWNDLGHARWAKYDDALGVPTVTLENVQHTQWIHDGLGRRREIRPDGAAKLTTTYALRENANGKFVGMDVTTEGEAGDVAEISADELGRTVEQRHRGFGDQWIQRAIRYDVLGRAHFASRPGYAAPAPLGTVSERDTLDRLTREIQPDNTGLTQTHSFFETSTVDAEHRRHTVVRDVNGRVVSTISYMHHDPGKPWATTEPLPTRFTYAAFDLVESIEDPDHNVITILYDKLGRRKYLDDPDAEVSKTFYNGFGERRVHSTEFKYDQAGHIVQIVLDSTEFKYDQAGRIIKITNTVDGITEYVWDKLANDPSPNGMGQLVEATSPDGTKTRRSYDAHGRLNESSWEIGAESFAVSVAYNPFGRAERIDYPKVDGLDRVSLGYTYNARNYLRQIRDVSGGAPGDPIWLVSARNVDDDLEKGYFGGTAVYKAIDPALTLSRTHYADTGRLKTVKANPTALATPVFDLLYQYHDNGQVAKRIDGVASRTEVFEYDDIDRLDQWTLKGPKRGSLSGTSRDTDYGYDRIGNLTEVYVDGSLKIKNHYDGAKPHALEWSDVTGVGIDDFEYDVRGRQKLGGGRDDIDYSSFDLPTSIKTPKGQTTFSYDAQRSRVRKAGPDGDVTISIGGLYERRGTGPGAYQHVFRVHGGEGPVAELVYDEKDPSAKVTTRFIVGDTLGSTSLVTDAGGTVLERLFFEPFGQRINASGATVAAATTTQHGFTDHWHDDELELIDMRGRVYDPNSRGFLTPDPLVPNPLFGQAYNRYSYAFNDPLNHIDPTGFDPDEGNPPVGTTPTIGGGGHGPCGAGDCQFGRDGGGSPLLLRSDAEGWQGFGCPQSTGTWGSGPCPSGQVWGGCGGAILSGAEIRAALAATIAHNNAIWEADEPLRREVEKWYKSGKSSRATDELMWQVGGGVGPAPIGYAVWGLNAAANAGHMIGVAQVADALALGGVANAARRGVSAWLGGREFWRGLLADTKGSTGRWSGPKVINTKLPHAAERAVERAGFPDTKTAAEALRAFGNKIRESGIPSTAVNDAAGHLIVPGFGEGGAVVYRVTDTGKLVLQTVHIWIP